MKYHYNTIDGHTIYADSLSAIIFLAQDTYRQQAIFANKMRDIAAAVLVYNKSSIPVAIVTTRVTRLK